jgi:hypothetical protein
MQVSLHHKRQVVDQGALKTEGATPIFRDRNLGRKGRAVYSYSKA